jgi:hypothetical protein
VTFEREEKVQEKLSAFMLKNLGTKTKAAIPSLEGIAAFACARLFNAVLC